MTEARKRVYEERIEEYEWFKSFRWPDERIARKLGITPDALGIMLRRREGRA
jgi:hypothetical protein